MMLRRSFVTCVLLLAGSPLLQAQMGASTGAAVNPEYDAQGRPITAGGFVVSGRPVFRDITPQAGLAGWRHYDGAGDGAGKVQYIVESLGSGVALLDYDRDGWLDIYLVSAQTYDGRGRSALFHNNHDGTFTDVAPKAGVTNDRWGVGAVAADYDNDGWPDIFVSNYGKSRLYHNNRDGTFTDVAAAAGVQLDGFYTGATFGDYDSDGSLDLFVPGYVQYDIHHPPAPGSKQVVSNTCTFRQVEVFCGPRGLAGEHDHLFHQDADGTFTDVSVKAGVNDRNGYYGLVSLFIDLDGDGLPELLVGNDSTPNYLYRNKGDGTFEDASYESGFAVNGEGREVAAMGLAAGDYRNEGRLSLLVTDFSDDYKLLLHNDGALSFTDVSYDDGIARSTLPFLGWGVGFLDYDNDGFLDVLMANGHVYPQADQQHWGTSFRQRPLLFRNDAGKGFRHVAPVEGSGLAVVIAGRGAAFGDLFNDGRIDAVINSLNQPPTLLRNVSEDHHHWLGLQLIGSAKSSRDALGAVVTARVGGLVLRQDALRGGSFASSNDPRLHFGLGDATQVDELKIRWPSGAVQTFKAVAADRILTLEEGHNLRP